MNLFYRKGLISILLFCLIIIFFLLARLLKQKTENLLLTKQLEDIKQDHRLLLAKYELILSKNNQIDDSQGPPLKYEEMRRRIYSNIKELWYYISHAMNKILNNAHKTVRNEMQDVLKEIANRKMSLLSDFEMMVELDGWHEWRQKEAAKVSELIQKRLRHLMNSSNCSEKELTCYYEILCRGSSCLLHHVVLCLIIAYGTKGKVLFDDEDRIFSIIKPVSNSCYNWTYEKHLQDVLSFLILSPKGWKFRPQTIPKDLAARIQRFNGDPASWWIGQLLKFLLKYDVVFQEELNKTIDVINFSAPIVGVHIRRSDKITTGEAQFHKLSEYMTHVKDYYDQLELTKHVYVRRVFIATDDFWVVQAARMRYPEYEFLYDERRIAMADPSLQENILGMKSALMDIHLLSMCDYIVCTFSSSLCRKAYELMQTNRVDASNSFFSLDDIYYVCGQKAHNRKAVIAHVGDSKEISFKVGDLIGVAGNHWDGYGKGKNVRTNQQGLFPWYKTTDQLVVEEFPEYKEELH